MKAVSTAPKAMYDTVDERACPACGKPFILRSVEHVYVIHTQTRKERRKTYYCSYSCWRKAGGGGGRALRGEDKGGERNGGNNEPVRGNKPVEAG